MSVAVIRSPEAVRDVENIVQCFVDQNRPATAVKFAKAVTRTVDLLVAFPDIGAPWVSKSARLQSVRFKNVRGFKNNVIFYRLADAGLNVMRVFHGRRNIERQWEHDNGHFQ
jgi:toxin ParE1/3/4